MSSFLEQTLSAKMMKPMKPPKNYLELSTNHKKLCKTYLNYPKTTKKYEKLS